MKTRILLMLCVAVLFFCAACSEQNSSGSSEYTQDENGVMMNVSERGAIYFPDTLPYELTYNKASVSLSSVAAYQLQSNYSYALFIVAELDISALTDTELHWLRESDLDMNAYLTHEQNDYDFDSMSTLGSLLLSDTGELFYVFMSSAFKENRYEFSGAKVTLVPSITQEDTYEYKNSEGEIRNLHKSESLHYSITVSTDIASPETIDPPLYDYVADWLRERADAYANILG